MTRRGEFDLIASLFAPLAGSAPGALGLRDDAALITPSPGHELVVTTDTLIAGVHFFADDPPDQIAQKALRVNLSDLAAKGAMPLAVFQALALGADTTDEFLKQYAKGLGDDLAHFGVALLGGDTTAMPTGGPLVITITAFGEVPRGTATLRRGAQVGDLVCVSGTIGDAAIGLRILRDKLPPVSDEHRSAMIARYRVPHPRLKLGQALRGIATSCLDISDGLCADVGHLCAVSGVSADILWHTVPISLAAQRRLADDPSLATAVLGGGDDYELAFTIVPADRDRVLALAHQTQTPVTVIGHTVAHRPGSDVKVIGSNGQEIEVSRPGFIHH